MSNMLVSYKKQNCLPFASLWIHPPFFGRVRVVHLFNFLCVVLYLFFFVYVLCLVYPMFQCLQAVHS